MRVFVMCVVLLGCKQSTSTSSTAGSGSGSVAVVADAAVAVDAAVVQAVMRYDSKLSDPGLVLAFDKQVPELPAISADGKRIAWLHSDAAQPSAVSPYAVMIGGFDKDDKPERLEIVDNQMSAEAEEQFDGETWQGAPIEKLHERAAAIKKRFADGGFSTLTEVVASGGDLPAKIGTFTLAVAAGKQLELVLTDGSGKEARRETVTPPKGKCAYTPMFGAAYTDAAKQRLYVEIVHKFRAPCSPLYRFVAFDLAGGGAATAPGGGAASAPSDSDALATVFSTQLDKLLAKDASLHASDAQVTSQKGLGTAAQPGFELAGGKPPRAHKESLVQVQVSRDGKSAWASGVSTVPAGNQEFIWRISNVLVKTTSGWRIAAAHFTEPVDNATVNDQAKAGTWKQVTFKGAAGDAALQAAFAKLTTDGIDAAAAASPDLVTFGSGHDERTVGGSKIAKPWAAAWKRKTTITSSIARVTPSGTTGWVVANVVVQKKGFKLPFIVFCIFDKATTGEWTLVHMHLAV